MRSSQGGGSIQFAFRLSKGSSASSKIYIKSKKIFPVFFLSGPTILERKLMKMLQKLKTTKSDPSLVRRSQNQ